jgi:subtilisin-like proprotein convertase family protein
VPGTIEKLTVTLNGFTHAWPDDVDVLLVSPGGQNVFLMSDAGGGTAVSGLALTFDDAAEAPIQNENVPTLVSGTYQPFDYPEQDANGTDTYPLPAPASPYGSTLSVFNGINPNGVWKLFVADDENVFLGNISGGWSLTITNSITAQNTNAITLPSSGTASLYPSTANVSGLFGSVVRVAVVLNNFSHAAPDDVDLLLVSPNGRKVTIMSDVGGTTAVSNLLLTIDDNAASSFPDNGPLVSGAFRPTNFEPGDAFPAPAPSGVSGNTLSTFNGINPNGAWSLYAVDDTGGNVGSISGGWSLAINTSTSACSFSITPSLQAFPFTGGAGSIDVSSPFACDWVATTTSGFVTIDAGSSGGSGSGVVTYTVAPNMGAGRTAYILISSASTTRNFTIQQPSGCPFSVSQETQNFGGAGGAGSVQVTAAGACGWTALTKDDWISITSGSGSGNGTASFIISPNGTGHQRIGSISIGARTLTIIQNGLGVKAVFDFDGDNKTDYAVVRDSGGTLNWYLQRSTAGFAAQPWGATGDTFVPGDYDGDGKWDIGIWRDGTFYILKSSDGTLRTVAFGAAGDDARITQDFDGDGKADPAVARYDNTTGLNWYIRESLSGNLRAVTFGSLTDVPVRGDFDGDGKADPAVYRRNDGTPANTFFVVRSSDSAIQASSFGSYGADYVMPGDFDGDGKTDYAVWRGRNGGGDGTWYWLQSSDGAFRAVRFGIAGNDLPAPGDYDGDGRTDPAVWRPGASATFYVYGSAAGFIAVPWGTSGDLAPAFSLQAR